MKTLQIIFASLFAVFFGSLTWHILAPESLWWLNTDQLIGCGMLALAFGFSSVWFLGIEDYE